MKFSYNTKGTCASTIFIEVEDNKLQSLEFLGGCNGNLKGIAALCKGMDIDEIIERLKGIRCGFKSTSCPDQLAEALLAFKNKV